jgi:hypothetical protein
MTKRYLFNAEESMFLFGHSRLLQARNDGSRCHYFLNNYFDKYSLVITSIVISNIREKFFTVELLNPSEIMIFAVNTAQKILDMSKSLFWQANKWVDQASQERQS